MKCLIQQKLDVFKLCLFSVFLLGIVAGLNPSTVLASNLHGFSGRGQIDLVGIGSRKAVMHIRRSNQEVNNEVRPLYYGVFSIADTRGDHGAFMTIQFDKVSFAKDGRTVHLHTRALQSQGKGVAIYSINAVMDEAGMVHGKLSSNQIMPGGDLLEGSFHVALQSV